MTSWSRCSLLALQALFLYHRARYARWSCGPHITLLSPGSCHTGRAGPSLLSRLPVLPGESIQASLPRSANVSRRSRESRGSLGSPHAHLARQPWLSRFPPDSFAAVSPRGTGRA